MPGKKVSTFNSDNTNQKSAMIVGTAYRGTDGELYVTDGDQTLGALNVAVVSGTLTSGPLQYTRNGASTLVTLDTATAANNRPLPTTLLAGDSLGPVSTGIGISNTQTVRVHVGNTDVNPIPVDVRNLTLSVLLGDSLGNGLNSTLVGAKRSLDVNVTALPASAATSANQATEIASLASIDGKTAALVGGRVPMDASGTVFAGNSSTTPLAAAGVFTGTAQDTLGFGTITIQAFSNVASAIDGLAVEWSTDGTNWDDSDPFTVDAGNGRFFTFGPQARFFRLRYTNGATLQTAFRLQTIGKIGYVKPSSHRLSESITDDSDAELQKAVVAGRTAAGTYVNAAISTAGALSTSGNEFAASNYGTPAATTTQRVAAMIGVGTAAASSANPVPVDIFTNTIFATSVSASQRTYGTTAGTFVQGTQSLAMGWQPNSSTHREMVIDPNGSLQVSDGPKLGARLTSPTMLPYIIDFAVSNLTTAYTTVVATTIQEINAIQLQNHGNQPVYIATGAAAAEVVHYIVLAGGDSTLIRLNIATGSRIAIRSHATTISSGFLVINAFA